MIGLGQLMYSIDPLLKIDWQYYGKIKIDSIVRYYEYFLAIIIEGFNG